MLVRKSSAKNTPLKRDRAAVSPPKLNRAEALRVRTWVEINAPAARANCRTFRRWIGSRVKLWSVVKSNAYGHGLMEFARVVGTQVDGFCVDSLVEARSLRQTGVAKHILVLGPTLNSLLPEAAAQDVTVSVANIEALRALSAVVHPPAFHLKIDTGMHRQGFYLKDIPRVLAFLKRKPSTRAKLTGLFTHFASAKDINYPTYTVEQFRNFQEVRRLFVATGYGHLLAHCSATGGTLINKKYHLDAVRVGIGLYGLWPSKELEIQFRRTVDSGNLGTALSKPTGLNLQSVLSWRTIIMELKDMRPGDYVGYDMFERLTRRTRAAILPVGYWHGFPRALSGVGEVLVRGRRARVLGRVSMDILIVDVTNIACRVGDRVTLLGRDRQAEVSAFEVAARAGTIHYELVTRLNPRMKRIIVSR